MCISAATAMAAFVTLKGGMDAKKAAATQAKAIRDASQQQAAQAAESARAAAMQQESEIAREQALREAASLEKQQETATPEVQVGQEALVASGESARRRKVGAQFNIRAGADSAGSPGGLRL